MQLSKLTFSLASLVLLMAFGYDAGDGARKLNATHDACY